MSPVARLVVAVIRGYQLLISPLRPPACRFTPSCSSYALVAVDRFGVVRGGWLSICRLGRCHPWHAGGHDPVPSAVEPDGRTPDHAAPPAHPADTPTISAA